MQARKLSDDKIWDIYRKIMNGESLTKVAKEITIDRGTLRNYIEQVVLTKLSEEEKQKFIKKSNSNFRGNSTGEGRKGRDKKKKQLQTEEYITARQEIQKTYGISDEILDVLFNKLRSKKNTSYNQGTFIIKFVEFLDYFCEKGITAMQVVDMIMRRPQIFTADIRNTINPIIEALEQEHKNGEGAIKIYENPSIITRCKRKIEETNKMENGSDKNGRIFTNDAEVPGNEK